MLCRLKHDQRDTPRNTQVSEGEITVADPRHPLYGRTLKLNGFAFLLGHIRHCQVEIRSGRIDYVPLASTNVSTEPRPEPTVLWERLPIEAKKTMLRALVAAVNLSRDGSGVLRIRIVWRGGLVSERAIRIPVDTIRGTERERCIVERIRALACAGQTDVVIAEHLEQEGFTSCQGGRFTAEIVWKHRSEHQIRSGLGTLRRGDRPPGYTIIEMAQQLDIDPQWIYRGIAKGRIVISMDARYGCYVFPRTKSAVERMKRLKRHKLRVVTFRKEHGDE